MTLYDSNRVQFRKYLERAGVVEALNNAFLKLYEEENKPDDVTQFVIKAMSRYCPTEEEFSAMKKKLKEVLRQSNALEEVVDRYKSRIVRSRKEINDLLENGYQRLLNDIDNPPSLLRIYLTDQLFNDYKNLFTPAPVEASLLDCVQSGLEHLDSRVGIYAADPESYDIFNKIFDPIIRHYHEQRDSGSKLQLQPDFGNIDVENFDPERKYRPSTRILITSSVDEFDNIDPERRYILSTRIRVSRNIKGYPFFAKLTEQQFKEVEEKVIIATEALTDELAGTYFRLKDIDLDTQDAMIERHILFKKENKFLRAAGCYRFWPDGRGIYVNAEESFILWVNAEDHLRIISMEEYGELGTVYNRLLKALKILEKKIEFVNHPRYGYLTACPTNLGTSLRASVLMYLPYLSQDSKRLHHLVNRLNLQIRGTYGENTPIVDGIIDISNNKRLGLSEYDLVKTLKNGIIHLIREEEKLLYS